MLIWQFKTKLDNKNKSKSSRKKATSHLKMELLAAQSSQKSKKYLVKGLKELKMLLLKSKMKLKETPRVNKNHQRKLKSLLPLKREQGKIEIFEFS
jgi:hypothetical protein